MNPPDADTYTRISQKTGYVDVPAGTTTGNLSSGGNLSVAGHAGDVLTGLTLVPATTSPGQVQIKDGSLSAVTVFNGGASSLADLKPIGIDLHGIISKSGGWQLTTGGNVTVIAEGIFTP
jgi:hypothetical protein